LFLLIELPEENLPWTPQTKEQQLDHFKTKVLID
jgi:hypothetical protein